MKVMIVVTHLLGVGHLHRAAELARAFDAAGHRVVLVSGGRPVAGMAAGRARIVQLPPLASDGTDFRRLLDADGTPAGADYHARRQADLLRIRAETEPDILITELFPFGRRVLSEEFLGLVSATRAAPRKPVVLASVRDILAPPSTEEKAQRTEAIVAGLYDGVLVHADPDVITLDASWPVGPGLRSKLHYTGFVAPAPASAEAAEGAGRGEVLVSAGGGPVGHDLFRAALRASRGDARRWRLLVGGADAGRLAELRNAAPENAVVEPARPDFRAMLYHAAASISLCGYNTAMDLLQAGTPAVLVPFDEGGETEQRLRANTLARLPGVDLVPTGDLSADRLRKAVAGVIADRRRCVAEIRQDGASESVRICAALHAARR